MLATGHRDEYDAVCASWRELSRNKSRDEREMWPNRSSHTDTVFHVGCSQRKRERGISPFSIPRLLSMAVPSAACRGQNFQVISPKAISGVNGPLVAFPLSKRGYYEEKYIEAKGMVSSVG